MESEIFIIDSIVYYCILKLDAASVSISEDEKNETSFKTTMEIQSYVNLMKR